MQTPKRVAIADRSLLAHNIYRMILKPFDFSLFFYKTLRDLKESSIAKQGPILLINTNTFGKYFETHVEWLKKDPAVSGHEKIFLCDDNGAETSALKKIPQSRCLLKPFDPQTLKEVLQKIYERKTS